MSTGCDTMMMMTGLRNLRKMDHHHHRHYTALNYTYRTECRVFSNPNLKPENSTTCLVNNSGYTRHQ